MEPSRLDVVNKLKTLAGMSQSAMYSEMSAWAATVSKKPEMVVGDLMSYSIYAEAE